MLTDWEQLSETFDRRLRKLLLRKPLQWTMELAVKTYSIDVASDISDTHFLYQAIYVEIEKVRRGDPSLMNAAV